MASKQGLTAVHISLIFFVPVSMVLAAVAYLNYRELGEVNARAAKAESSLQTEQKAHRELDQNVQDLKKKIGFDVPRVGAPDAAADGTALGELNDFMKKSAPGELAQGTVRETFIKMSEALAQLTQERTGLNAEKAKLQETVNGLQKQYQEAVTANEHSRENAEKDRDQAQRTKEETIQAKDTQINELDQRARNTALELQQEKDASAKMAADRKQHIDRLTAINTALREKQEKEEDLSFDTPDGIIEWIDHNSGLVWINLGEADGLKKQTSFSVYRQGHYGVGRHDKRDIKGAVEVTRILGAHQAEARIVDRRLKEPIAPGDPIYTPLWGSGKKEHVALVGIDDLDSDGLSDRARLHEIVESSGAVFDLEINDQGERVPADAKLNVHTKFLIVGQIPDPTKSKPEELKAHQEIGKRHQELMAEAREQGIRVISLNDFLDFIGYKAKRRLWQQGLTKDWNLKKGAQSTGVTSSRTTPPESTGHTSEIFTKKRVAPPVSTGKTSKAVSGGK